MCKCLLLKKNTFFNSNTFTETPLLSKMQYSVICLFYRN
uniref:Uncharacterized protein n=1 Tax=Anguilla anguilla TaxID=7936 RepID=A0A0E9R476_ANGAN